MNHRVLVFTNLAALTSASVASSVLGQPDMVSVRANRGKSGFSPSLNGFNLPSGVSIVGDSLWVADTENNRLVRYDGLAATPTPALVVGQPDGDSITNANVLTDSTNPGYARTPPTSATSILRPRSVAVMGSKLYVSEASSHRIHVLEESSRSYVHAGMLGQTSPDSASANAGGVSGRSLSTPMGLAVTGSRLFVADSGNHRVLAFDAPSVDGFAAASTVLGQGSFVSNGFNQSAPTSADGAPRPRGLAMSNGELFVAETSQHRIAVHELPLVSGKAPKRLLGQVDGAVILPNAGGDPSASSLRSPRGVFADRTRIVVADTGNHRVLVFPRGGSAASLVLGQSSFAAADANRGGAVSAGSLAAPEGVYSDGTRLIVADTGNHRLLVWKTFPTTNGQPADLVLGQESMTVGLPNRGLGVAGLQSLARPSGLAFDGTQMFVADSGNNRVLKFDALPSADGAAASRVLGQVDATSNTPAADASDATKLAGPCALAMDDVNLYVAERDTSRIAVFSLANGGSAATSFLGSSTGIRLSSPGGVVVEHAPFFTSRLIVADTNNARLISVVGLSRLLSP